MPTPAARPNILLVMTDSLAPHFTVPYGDATGATPNLAELARHGVTFERAVPKPMTRPGVASAMCPGTPHCCESMRQRIPPFSVSNTTRRPHSDGHRACR